MSLKNDFAYAFIDLARLGRTDSRAFVLTILILACLSAVGTFAALLLPIPGMQAYRSLYFHHFSVGLGIQNVLTDAGNPIGILGFWLACKLVLRRPFGSLISIDLSFSVKRFLFGAALFLVGYIVSVGVMWLYAGARFDIWTSPIGHFHMQIGQNVSPILGALSGLAFLVGVSFFAFAEELYMRGWLTQMLGQYIRLPIVVALLIAVSFALLHVQYKWPVKAVMFFSSLGFSALTLRDRRLELAVGAHAMGNVWVGLVPMLFTGQQNSDFPISIPDAVVFAMIKGALPLSLMYLFLQRTSGWFRVDAAAEVADVHRV